MKNFKKMFSATMAAAMMASCVGLTSLTAAYAADPTYDVTIGNNAGEKHTLEAYEIFVGTPDDGVLRDIAWGSSIDAAGLVAALVDEEDEAFDIFNGLDKEADDDTLAAYAQKIASILQENSEEGKDFESDSESMIKFSRIVEANLTGSAIKSGTKTLKLDNAGYYLLKDKSGSPSEGTSTAYILRVVSSDDATLINIKNDAPEIDKDIIEGDDRVDANETSIGNTVKYELQSNVPNMYGFNKYFYIINDTIDMGLTFNDDVKVSIGGTALDEDDYYVEILTYYQDADGKIKDQDGNDIAKTFKIVLKDFVQYSDKIGDEIIVTYSAVLNQYAKVGEVGNVNKVDLTYSNNPNYTYEGIPDNPDTPEDDPKPDEPKPSVPDNPDTPEDESQPGDPTGKTPESKVTTFTSGFEIIKVDGSGKRLTGVEFEITGSGVTDIAIIETHTYVEDEEGTYYKLKTGAYTNVAPGGDIADSKYADTEKKYAEKVVLTSQEIPAEGKKITVAVGEDGVAIVKGLGQGTYTVHESKLPSGGYNSIPDFDVTVSATVDVDAQTCTWTNNADNIANEIVLDNGTYIATVVNNKGAVLPGTGGIGTVIFYVVGSLLMGGAAVLFVVKRKSEAKEG